MGAETHLHAAQSESASNERQPPYPALSPMGEREMTAGGWAHLLRGCRAVARPSRAQKVSLVFDMSKAHFFDAATESVFSDGVINEFAGIA